MVYQIDYMGPLVADAKAHPERHVTMDVDTRDMKREYDRLMQADSVFAAAMHANEKEQTENAVEAPDLVTSFIERQKTGDSRQSELAATLCRGIMTLIMSHASQHKAEPLDPVLLHLRNRHLASQLLADKRDKFYVTYGAAHLPGVMALMLEEPGWKVASIKWMRTIAAPEHLEGKL